MKKVIAGFALAIIILFIVNLSFSSTNIFHIKDTRFKQDISDNFLGVKKVLAVVTDPASAAAAPVYNTVGLSNKLDFKVSGSDPAYMWVFQVWDFCMSLVNIVLIGFLIFLGIVNVLHINYDTYQLKKMLLPLVLAVILANLSLFICRGIVDFSDAITNTFAQNRDAITQGIISGLLPQSTTAKVFLSLIPLGLAVLATGSAWSIILVIVIFFLIIFLIFLLLTVIMYIRQFIILILAAVSPLAFIFMVLPATQGLFKKWWDWFLRWVFMGPVILLILKIASIIGATNHGTLSFFVFVATAGLMIAAIMVPWLLAGSVMGKIQSGLMKTGGWAGKNVPGVSHVASAIGLVGGEGALGKLRADREKSNKMAGAWGRGAVLQMQRKGSIKEQMDYEKERQGEESASELIKVKGPNHVWTDKEFEGVRKNHGEAALRAIIRHKSGTGDLKKEEIEALSKMGLSAKTEKSIRTSIINNVDWYNKRGRSNEAPKDLLEMFDSRDTKPINDQLKKYNDTTIVGEKAKEAEKLINVLEKAKAKADSYPEPKDGDHIRNAISKVIGEINPDDSVNTNPRLLNLKNNHLDLTAIQNALTSKKIATEHHEKIKQMAMRHLTDDELQSPATKNAIEELNKENNKDVFAGIIDNPGAQLKRNLSTNIEAFDRIRDAGQKIVNQTPLATPLVAQTPSSTPPPTSPPVSSPVTSILRTDRKISL